MARKKHPYIVVPLRFNQFYDLQKVAKENYGSFKQTTDGEKVNWGKIKIIKIDKKEEHTSMESHSIWVCPLSKNFCSIVSKLPEFW
jgi:hypothetical protein